MINRSPYPLKIAQIESNHFDTVFDDKSLVFNEWMEIDRSFALYDTKSSHPYWLRNDHEAFFQISDKGLTGKPEISVAPSFLFHFSLEGNEGLDIEVPVTYKHVDRVKGELSHTVFISPEVIIHPLSELIFFKPGEKKKIEFQITSFSKTGSYDFYPGLSEGWEGPEKIQVEFKSIGKPVFVNVDVKAPSKGSELLISPFLKIGDQRFDQDRLVIDYDHIDAQMLSPKVHDRLLSLDVSISGEHIAYLEGAGDEVPKILSEMGYHVSYISVEDLGKELSPGGDPA